jgi:glycerol-1-phosphate dehydrogenase [NAD(P)+]
VSRALSTRSPAELLSPDGFDCACGRRHRSDVKEILLERGAIRGLSGILERLGGTRPFLIDDPNTHGAAGALAETVLRGDGLTPQVYTFGSGAIEPDETALGHAIMAFDRRCNAVVGIGGGTVNDIGKMVAFATGLPYVIVATAPSMDGFASATSSMISRRSKVSLDSVCAAAIVADLDILSAAPLRLLQAGVGDIIAKYVSICEWRISHLVNGEYFCPEVAALIRREVGQCMASAQGVLRRDPEAVRHVMEGLILTGMAMAFAGVSRPASGMEHYFSHLWDMRGLEFHSECDLHGIQVGVATVLTLRIYDMIRAVVPDRARALNAVARFSYPRWTETLRGYLGSAAEELIRREASEGKYDMGKHGERLEIILRRWPDILQIVNEEMPESGRVRDFMTALGMPVDPQAIGIGGDEARLALQATKDIRDKYIGSRLLWDLGLLEELAARL